ncbi:MAG: DUF4407 domain-containing protein [Paludibacteraceae bacterium]|nr:DUF4407 domain-containing protein [Paludibacteraceae bacterium]
MQALLAALTKLQTKAEENWKKISGGGTTGNKKLEKSLKGVSVAMAVMNEAISEVRNEFGEMFSEATNDALDLIQTCLSAGKGVMDTLLAAGIATSEGIKEAERGSVILAIIQAAIQVTMALIKVLMNFTKNAQLQKQIDGLKDEIDSIDRLYERAERATKKLSGSEFWRKTIKDTRILNKEIEKYNEAIAAAQELLNNSHTQKAKRKAQEQLDDLVDARNKIEDELADVYTNFYEHFMTTNVEDFSHSLAQNIVDGFSEGLTDLSSVFNDAISDLMKSIIVEQMTEDLRKLFEPAFEQIRWSFNNGDTTFDKNEERFALEALEKAKDQAEGIVDYYKDMFDMLNLDLTDLEASSGAFQGMTQDTAEELNGRFTALQMSGASIDLKLDKTNQALSSLSATASSVADGIALLSIMASNQLTALEEIRDNTAKLNSMDRTLRTMQTSLMTLAGE